tara:strand:- start:62 stop:580 length:519 start_codon:yes stop_codon:yes gene_type:complete
MEEVFKDIPNYEGLYQVSNLGNVKSLDRVVIRSNGKTYTAKEKILKNNIGSRFYYSVKLYNNKKIKKSYKVHQLVAIAFLNHKPCGYDLVVNHKNFNKLDNRVVNLELVTQRENANHKHIKSSSKYTGVSWDKRLKKWSSKININNKSIHLGMFKIEIEASLKYQEALKNLT